MKRILIFFAFIALALFILSCSKEDGSGPVVTEFRSVSGFTSVSLAMEGDVYFVPDSVYSVEIQAQRNIIDIIETNLEGNRLVLELKNKYVLGKHSSIKFFIHAPDVSKLDISGSGNINTEGRMEEPTLNYSISGSGNININELNSGTLTGNISGSGNLTATSGWTDYENLTISGSGNANFLGVAADTVYITISGSGNATVNAVKFLDVTISGSGNVKYSGSPVINTHISGSGTVTHI